MGSTVLVLKYIDNSIDRKRRFKVCLYTLERKIPDLEIMTGCKIHMDVLKTATSISSGKTHKKDSKITAEHNTIDTTSKLPIAGAGYTSHRTAARSLPAPCQNSKQGNMLPSPNYGKGMTIARFKVSI